MHSYRWLTSLKMQTRWNSQTLRIDIWMQEKISQQKCNFKKTAWESFIWLDFEVATPKQDLPGRVGVKTKTRQTEQDREKECTVLSTKHSEPSRCYRSPRNHRDHLRSLRLHRLLNHSDQTLHWFHPRSRFRNRLLALLQNRHRIRRQSRPHQCRQSHQAPRHHRVHLQKRMRIYW